MFGVLALLATNIAALSIPYFLGRAVEDLRNGKAPSETVPRYAFAILALALCQGLTRITSRITIFNAARKAEFDLRSELFRHLLTLDRSFYSRNSTGDVMSRLTSDVQTVRAMYGPGLLNLVNTAFMFTVALVLMISINPSLTFWALLPYPSMFILGKFFGRQIYKASSAVQKQIGSLSTDIQEDLSGIGIVKSYHLEEHRLERFSKVSKELIHKNMAVAKIRGMLVPILGAVAVLGTIIVLYVGGNAVIRQEITLGQMVQFSAYLALLVWPTLALGWMLSLFQRGKASWSRLLLILETKPNIVEGEKELQAPIQGDVRITDLNLSLDDKPILKHINLHFKPGTTNALVGRTGSGKTVLAECLTRGYSFDKDTITIDGVDICDLRFSSLRKNVGYAPQEAYLFSTTIDKNIQMGSALAGASSAVHMDVLIKAAGLSKDLAGFPNGMDTMVGERGVTLSGGQRQRVALARALATEAPLLILDDSLSAVDADTEQEILNALTPLLKNRTSVIISHRIAAIQRASHIVVLDEGAVVEEGTHADLIQSGGVYSQIYRDQLSGQFQ